MEIRTFTSFWNTERKLYAIYDISLPVPISLKVVGAFAAAAVPWAGLMTLLHVPFTNPAYLIWIIPPLFLGFIASKPIYQRKSIVQYATSLAKFYTQPKRLAGLRTPQHDVDREYNVITKVFRRKKDKKDF
jgi:phosphate/sulfate permease